MNRLASRLAVLLLLVPAIAAAQAPSPSPTEAPVSLRATAEPREVSIGDPIRYTVEVTASSETEIVFPLLAGQIGDFSITDFGEVPARREGDRLTLGRWYTLTVWEPGDKLIPKPKIMFRIPGEPLVEAEGNEVLIGVASMLAPSPGGASPEEAALRDIRPPEAPPFDPRPYAIIAAAVAAVLLLLAGVYYLLNRPKFQRVVPPRPAHEIALDALVRLRAQKFVEQGKFEEYYVGLSALVRRYLEDGFGLRAPEMTTEEFLVAASADRRLAVAHRRVLAEFLSQADLVKFAKHLPGQREAEAAYDAAKRFIDETRPSPASLAEGASRAAA